MARPKAKELTSRELELMHIFWRTDEASVAFVRDELARKGHDLAYTTVATLVRILCDKHFLEATNDERPFRYRAVRTYEDVSSRLLGDLVDRVFGGSRELLLVRLLGTQKLSANERDALQKLLKENQK